MTIPKLLLAATLLAAPVYAQDLKALEGRADAEFTRHDCPAAEKTYALALQIALAAGEVGRTTLYRMRLANCRARIGDYAAALGQ